MQKKLVVETIIIALVYIFIIIAINSTTSSLIINLLWIPVTILGGAPILYLLDRRSSIDDTVKKHMKRLVLMFIVFMVIISITKGFPLK